MEKKNKICLIGNGKQKNILKIMPMKPEWKNFNAVSYRRIKETATFIMIEYNGGIGGYAKGEYASDEEFIKNSEKRMNEILESSKRKESEKTKDKNQNTIFERWQSETGFDE